MENSNILSKKYLLVPAGRETEISVFFHFFWVQSDKNALQTYTKMPPVSPRKYQRQLPFESGHVASMYSRDTWHNNPTAPKIEHTSLPTFGFEEKK